jgi:surface antigen
MPAGHVAMVSRIVNNREVLLDHANWSYRGGIEHDVRAIDVSPNNDWSDVRVWYGPIHDLGIRSNPAHGFIYPETQRNEDAPVQYASFAGSGSR